MQRSVRPPALRACVACSRASKVPFGTTPSVLGFVRNVKS